MNAQIARHLNVAETAILKVEEWTNVIFAVVKGIGARFVSKKVVKVQQPTKSINWQTDPRYGFAEEVEPNGSNRDRLMNTIGWMVDRDSIRLAAKWTTFDLNGSYYPRDISKAIADAKADGFSVFYNKQQNVVGVLTEQI